MRKYIKILVFVLISVFAFYVNIYADEQTTGNENIKEFNNSDVSGDDLLDENESFTDNNGDISVDTVEADTVADPESPLAETTSSDNDPTGTVEGLADTDSDDKDEQPTRPSGEVTEGDFSYLLSEDTAIIIEYLGTDDHIIIPESVSISDFSFRIVGIGDSAFAENENIIAIEMPDTIETIGDNSFYGCINLSNITRSGKKEMYVFIGDSYGRGRINSEDDPERSWIYFVSQKNGFENCFSCAVNGKGVASGIPGYYGESDQSFSSLIYETGAPSDAVTQVVIMGGYNDYSWNPALIEKHLQDLCIRTRSYFPNAVVSIGMCSASGYSYVLDRLDTVADCYKECTWYGCSYIEGIENVLKNNIEGYMSSDNVHPNIAGSMALGEAVSDYLACVLDLPSGLVSIGNSAFENCSSVKRVVYNSNAAVGDNAFANCDIPSYPYRSREPLNGYYTYGDRLWCYKNDEILSSYTDVALINNRWIYVKNGYKAIDYTGIAPNNIGWWRIVNGNVDFNCNTVEQNENGWWYCKGGKVQFNYTGIAPNRYGWWRIVNGRVDFNCNTVEQNENGWWYCKDGKVQFGYTGIAHNRLGWWRIVNGKVDFSCNTVEQNEYGWWYCVGGKVQFDYTGIAPNKYGWWKIQKGKVDFGFNGIASNGYGTWYCKNGKVQFDYTGRVYYLGRYYYVVNGRAY